MEIQFKELKPGQFCKVGNLIVIKIIAEQNGHRNTLNALVVKDLSERDWTDLYSLVKVQDDAQVTKGQMLDCVEKKFKHNMGAAH